MNDEIVVTVQGRGRVNLGKLAKHDRYIARVEPDGTIVMEPAVVVPLGRRGVVDARLPHHPSGIALDVSPVPASAAPAVLSGEEWVEKMKEALPPTDDDVTILPDGTRIDSKEKALAWLADIEAERERLRARGELD